MDLFSQTSYNDKLDLVIKLVTFIEFIHKVKIIHKEIDSKNLLISAKDNMIKLINTSWMDNIIEISKRNGKYSKEYSFENISSIYYTSPEAFEEGFYSVDESITNNRITTKYDIWCLGTLISEIFSGVIPWSNKVKTYNAIVIQLAMKSPFPIPKNKLENFPEIIKILEACTEIDVEKRFNATQLLGLLRNIEKK